MKEGKQREWTEGADDEVAQQTRSEEAALGCGQSASGPDLLNGSPLCLVMRKSITHTHPQGHLSTDELPKLTFTADEFFRKSCREDARWSSCSAT